MYNPGFRSLGLLAVACALLASPAAADSQARIVRLSDVAGGVQIDKNTGLGFENAFLNLPITQGTQLRTGEKGRAEVEFEDGSSLRLPPGTTVEFSALGSNEFGKRTSAVHLVAGRVYVNWLGKSGDEFAIDFSQEKVALRQPAHFRVAVSSSAVQVASFKNDLEVDSPSGPVKVGKKKMVGFDLESSGAAMVAKNIEEDPYDEWDRQSVSYHDEYAKRNSTPYGYGYSDLSYYGGYSNISGFGMLWQPYFMGAGWNPYMDGAWAFYPGLGYMWASAYPWGWMPYYYGNWVYVPNYGWGWQAGGFNTWHGGVHTLGTVAGFHAPVAPVGTVNTVVVGKGGPVLAASVTSHMVVSSGSAGLGIPRGSLSNLHSLNAQVSKSGSVELHAAPQFSAHPAHSLGGAYAGEHAAANSSTVSHPSAAPAGHAPPVGSHR